jgi:hypothetical protein
MHYVCVVWGINAAAGSVSGDGAPGGGGGRSLGACDGATSLN